jgi:hypothetical protein
LGIGPTVYVPSGFLITLPILSKRIDDIST